MATPTSAAAARAAATHAPEALNWDDEDWDMDHAGQADQQQQTMRSPQRPVATLAAPLAVQSPDGRSTPGIPENWDDKDPDKLVDDLVVIVVEPAVEHKAEEPANMPSAGPLLDTDATATDGSEAVPAVKETAAQTAKTKPATEKRYRGQIQFWKGSMGWVKADKVRTGRTVNPLGHSWSEMTDVIFLHRNDCIGFIPHQWADVNFGVAPGARGYLKCVDVTQGCQEEDRKTLEEHEIEKKKEKERRKREQQKAASMSNEDKNQELNVPAAPSKSKSTGQKIDSNGRMTKATGADASSDPNWRASMMEPVLTVGNVKDHERKSGSCNSSTIAGSSIRSASMTSSKGFARADDRRDVHSSIPVATAHISKHLRIEEDEPEKAAQDKTDKTPVPENWYDEVDDWDLPPLEGSWKDVVVSWEDELDIVNTETKLNVGDQIVKRNARGSFCKMLVNRKLTKGLVNADGDDDDDDDDAEMVGVVAEEENMQVGDKIGRKNSQGSSRKQLVNRKLVKRIVNAGKTDAPAPASEPESGQLEGRFAQFCQSLGPQFPFEFVARHLGTDFEAIVQGVTAYHSLDFLVEAGMKPLHRNKFWKALSDHQNLQH